MNSADPAEALLVLRAQAGDVDAFGRLYDATAPALRRYLGCIVGERADVDDLLQSVFFTVYRKVRWLKEPASFRPWLYRIAARQAFRTCRSRETQLTDDQWDEVQSHAASGADRAVLLDCAVRRIAQLPPASRAVLSLHYLEGMTLEEAAAVLGIPVGTAKSRLSFGIAKLRGWLGAEGR